MAKQRRRRRQRRSKLPKGAYRVPGGHHVVTSQHVDGDGRRYRVSSLRYDEPNLKALADAFIRLGRGGQYRNKGAS